MIFDAGHIVPLGAYRFTFWTCLFLIILTMWITYRNRIKDGKKEYKSEYKSKEEFLISSKKSIIFFIIACVFSLCTMAYLQRADIKYWLGGLDEDTLVEKVIYIDDLQINNGVRPIDENGNVYLHVYVEEQKFNTKVYDAKGEFCVIEYYNFSKVVQRITLIEDPKELGHLLSDEEIADLNIPPYPGDDGAEAPGENWEWDGYGKGKVNGWWTIYETGERLNPDTNFGQPFGAHWDYIRGDERYRIYSDGEVLLIDCLN